MKLPRDLSGAHLVKVLQEFRLPASPSGRESRCLGDGYAVPSSPIGARTRSFRVGTLNLILASVARAKGIAKSEILKLL